MAEVPLREGWFYNPKTPGEKAYLVGSRCRLCGYTSFPEKKVCIQCLRDDTMERMKLGAYGNLETYAVMRVGTVEFSAPYMVGYVRTKEGASVFTPITGCVATDGALEIGEEMELVIEKVKVDGRGNDVIGWKYRPTQVKEG
ncbi:MAG: OB-fold domain-containing protein [Thermodesulfobacteriota bacterium]